jgi:BirA family biotin operon repressor/biotin-[acetyl-CoA-carboxylase] ligase
MEIRWIRHDKVTSTNQLVREMLKHQKPKEGLVVIADYQEAGKGQGVNSWHSREGESISHTIAGIGLNLNQSEFPEFPQPASSLSVAICEVLDSLGTIPVIKWPNDILCPGGKVAGILIEHGISGGSISHTIAGIGLNLNQSEFPEFPQPASSLFLETGRLTVPKEFAEKLVERILIRYQKLKIGEGRALMKEYLHSLFRLGERSMFKAGGDIFEGIIRGVSEYGELLVEREGELSPYSHGEIILKEAYRTG